MKFIILLTKYLYNYQYEYFRSRFFQTQMGKPFNSNLLHMTSDNSLYQKQLKELIENEEGLLERKILVYNVLPKKYQDWFKK